MGVLLAGCWLHLMSGNVIYVSDIEEEVNEIITTVFSNSTAAICLNTDYGFYECTYIVEGDIITSTLYLLSELGLTGVLIDPLILQVPEDATLLQATYNRGNGVQPLKARHVKSFEAQPRITVQAEANQRFIILDIQPSDPPLTHTLVDLSLRLRRVRPINEPVTAQSIKAMFTAKVVVRGHTYYAPILPCVTDFAAIPAFNIPLSPTPQNLMPAIHSALQAASQPACDHKGYYFDGAPPPFSDQLYLPVALR
jgi:hypothetical protein